jgi:hypothetical protein
VQLHGSSSCLSSQLYQRSLAPFSSGLDSLACKAYSVSDYRSRDKRVPCLNDPEFRFIERLLLRRKLPHELSSPLRCCNMWVCRFG